MDKVRAFRVRRREGALAAVDVAEISGAAQETAVKAGERLRGGANSVRIRPTRSALLWHRCGGKLDGLMQSRNQLAVLEIAERLFSEALIKAARKEWASQRYVRFEREACSW